MEVITFFTKKVKAQSQNVSQKQLYEKETGNKYDREQNLKFMKI